MSVVQESPTPGAIGAESNEGRAEVPWRHDGPAKATGDARYVADMEIKSMLHAKLLYSGRARARIVRIDTARARELVGVHAVITQARLPDVRYGGFIQDRTLMAQDEVRFEGEVVAAVAARDEATAERARDLIEIEYEELDPVLDPESALASSSVLVHESWDSFGCLPGMVRDGNSCAYNSIERGDVPAAMSAAAHVVTERYVSDMAHPVPIEPRGVLAHWEGEKVTIWSSTQVPYVARSGVAQTLQIPERNVRVVVPHLGGGFGGKCELHFEPHVAALARATRRPVRLLFSREEEFIAPDMRHHPIVLDVSTGLASDGTITARRARVILDAGPYSGHSPMIAEIATFLAVGPYRIPSLDIGANTVYTNHGPSGSVRAPSGPQMCWAIEQHTDSCARAVDLDPVEFRMRNLLEDGDEGPTGQRMFAVGAKECLRQAVDQIEWGSERAPGEGVGVTVGWWGNYPMASGASVSMNVDGSLTVVTGANENGSGATAGLAVLAADEFGISPADVALVYQDTDASTPDHGSGGSQTTFNNGRAVVDAAIQVRQRVLQLAEERLEAAMDDLVVADGRVHVQGSPDVSVTFAEIAASASMSGEYLTASASPRPAEVGQVDVGNSQGRVFVRSFVAPSFFAHAVRANVDAETGAVRATRVVAAHDFGTVINPPGARGQVLGGVVHGLGIALLEGSVFDETGRIVNSHLLDYKLMTASDAPEISVVFVDRPSGEGGPRGLKGVGEAPAIGTAGAVANAIRDATGVSVRQLPMTPERVWAAMNATESTSS